MACFSLAWLENFLIWLVMAIVIVAIIKVILPLLMSLFGTPPGGGAIVTILSYVLWGIVAVFVIVFAFDLFSCMLGSGGVPSLRFGGVR